jgi:N-acetylglucosamine-6-phosphate deacetylase
MKEIICAEKVYTGDAWLTDTAIIYENDRILDLLPVAELDADAHIKEKFPRIVPAFIDIQIYGAAGKLLSVYPEADTLRKMYDYCKNGGAHWFLPAVSTNVSQVIYQSIDAVRKYWDDGGQGVPGLHIEGPWINKEKRGAHLEELIHPPEMDEVKKLLNYGKDAIKLITLAPEVCSKEVVELISSHGIVISAGHSNMTFSAANHAFNKIQLTTHLFNAMTGIHHRQPGLPAAVMLHPKVMSSIVPDGYHVDFNMIRLAKKLMQERLFIITDAVTPTDEGPYLHTLDGDKYVTGNILSGSSLTMLKGVQNLIRECEIAPGEAINMASLYPARALGLDDQIGIIKKGHQARLVCLDGGYNLLENIG